MDSASFLDRLIRDLPPKQTGQLVYLWQKLRERRRNVRVREIIAFE